MAIRVAMRYQGTVQGVGFRATVRSLASARPISGLVRNEPDGSVWLEAQGMPSDVEAYLAEVAHALRTRINTTHRHDMLPQQDEQGFRIDR
ncbi:MAG: acylphosphatase [Phycisphaeraceae bacterium]|nr:acylphosphatase [Phycisphaeraceae bacterium]